MERRRKTALITGVTGQDGSYLAELLLEKDYIVHGMKRRASSFNTERIDHLYVDPHEASPSFFLHYGDTTDATNLIRIVQETQPDEIYNLAAQSHVQVSFETPEYTANADGIGPLRLLEAIRILGLGKRTRFYQASTSELYGAVAETPQRETTPFRPRSPYAAAKLYAYWITVNYREAYGFHASNGILFNHEGPRRGETFVTRKITRAVAAIAKGKQKQLYLGNLEAKRDWGHAKDYARGMWLMLQQAEPDDFVLATGQSHSVRAFVEHAFAHVNRKLAWRGEGVNETGVDTNTGQVLVKIDPRYFRPTEVDTLCGDASKAHQRLGWQPTIGFEELVRQMVDEDLRVIEHGFNPRAMIDAHPLYSLKGKRVFVAGDRGMVGSALMQRLPREGCTLITAPRGTLDLRRQADVEAFFAREKPQAVFLAAARVGGILANDRSPANFLYDNLMIATNVIEAARMSRVEKLVNLGSTCVYPKFAPQPMPEDSLLTGALEPTNQWYAVAKIAAIKLCDAYRRQHGCDFISAMPTNLYGPNDNFDLEASHVIPALIAKFADAKDSGAAEVVLWGTGTPRREFLHVDDCADALVHLMLHFSGEGPVNVGTGDDLTIAELARMIADVAGYAGKIVFDPSRPDGTPRKLALVARLKDLGWSARIPLAAGLAQTYGWYRDNARGVRRASV